MLGFRDYSNQACSKGQCRATEGYCIFEHPLVHAAHYHAATLSLSACSRLRKDLMDTSTQMWLGCHSSFLRQLGTYKAPGRARLVAKNITDTHL